ncbi:TetR/AcrR family transcriptional regulator [Streptomyces sp. NBC_00257]|uniref:TetR/AcrR family transcriptional regulator n=1 Tax=unclassified Streptomyces TaxID=2593676 RepID=UPI00225133FC|nr:MULTISPECIES: TetR/AcrR family transcriptional regulator [unclassified Streptomyces]MCX5429136.1 TetR/AcrR family transcriptional regulator [Streptomyces sp. NBC_00062]WTB56659.1 TetR/AcrR family transcriptional regulator [Streptomyces sp. NBC_00826]WTH90458.1 TetR/AcrR family transcriptional regulator [Streptomyces sp. NBC_00825]WTH99185.1 TetR/AcrR family transcriptional regulator [Streptomyces sp. NBC_00822]
MPTAREVLLDAALSALATLPWTSVRMVDVASAAGVSRQTLHNEFGGKDGLARALVRDAADGYLTGVERALGTAGGTADRLAATAAWTVRAVRTNVLVKALLTGCWNERLPRPGPLVAGCPDPLPGPRSADPGPPTPAELLRRAGERAVAALDGERPPQDPEALAVTCEIALRLALSYALVPAPSGTGGEPAPLVRHVVARAPDAVSGTSPTAGARSPRGSPGRSTPA